MGMSLVENLVFLFFTQTLHASNLLCGISVLITVVFEIPLFQYSETILHTFQQSGLISLAMLAYGLRVIGYTTVPNGWYILFFEPLHGVTIACAQVASVNFASENAPLGLESTSQTLMGLLRFGIGFVVGTGLGGYIEDTYGSNVLYRSAGILVLTTMLAYQLVLRRPQQRW
jgi:MFS family permease